MLQGIGHITTSGRDVCYSYEKNDWSIQHHFEIDVARRNGNIAYREGGGFLHLRIYRKPTPKQFAQIYKTDIPLIIEVWREGWIEIKSKSFHPMQVLKALRRYYSIQF
jgi:hypothetical protein